jgi:hypothetical protein
MIVLVNREDQIKPGSKLARGDATVLRKKKCDPESSFRCHSRTWLLFRE